MIVDIGRDPVAGAATPLYPPKWANILNAPLSEGAISTYLGALYGAITDKFVPNPIIVQSLLYFTLNPPTPPLPPHTPTPLMVLYKIASLHPTSSLMKSHTFPTYPRVKMDTQQWLNWEADGDIEKGIKRRMRKCEKEGIWDLIWESGLSTSEGVIVKTESINIKKEGRRRRRDLSEDEDEDEVEAEGKKRVSENGWLILEWLVHIWERDQVSRGDYSLALLSQLPKQGEMQIDNPSLPLRVIFSVLENPSTGQEQRRRENIAGRLISLLVNTANPPTPSSKPPFHPSTLTLSILPLLRLPPPLLTKFLQILINSPIPRETITHFLIHGIEDLAGTRLGKIEERRRGTEDFVKWGWFPRPTIGYCLDILLLPPSAEGEEERMAILKVILISTMVHIEIKVEEERDGWLRSRDPSWRVRFVNGMSGHGGRVDGLRGVLVMMLDNQCSKLDQAVSLSDI